MLSLFTKLGGQSGKSVPFALLFPNLDLVFWPLVLGVNPSDLARTSDTQSELVKIRSTAKQLLQKLSIVSPCPFRAFPDHRKAIAGKSCLQTAFVDHQRLLK